MPTQTLSIVNLQSVPFASQVQTYIQAGLQCLIDSRHLIIDFNGTAGDARYRLEFMMRYDWTSYNRDRNWYRPGALGVTGTVNVEASRRRNYCTDVGDAATCEPVVRHTASELGKSLAVTAVHEIGHLFGLSEGGPDGSGHTGDDRNYMFINFLHREYVPLLQDFNRTTRYTIQRGDTLAGICNRIGFRSPLARISNLYNFQGQDRRRNRDMLRSGDPNLIYPGEMIWIPDYSARLQYMRRLELSDKSFTASQIRTMQDFLSRGRTIVK
ncbi:MAG: LysM peptidoglycan-binding domain-containing protein [Desulfobacteraceae bacterium]|nr:LysM peptidoglycan-binding domain-containing protein [Desulfobacteraceae bacterium]